MSEITVSVVGSSAINPTVGNGDIVNVSISETGEKGNKGDTGATGPSNVLTIGTVTQGTAAATLTGSSPSQVLNLVLPKGDAGEAVQLQSASGYIQWRYAGASTWTNLVALSAITGPQGSVGPAGAAVEVQATATHIQWRYAGASSWTNLVPLASLVGATGPVGPQGPAGPAANVSDETPQPLGVASAGSATTASRADHIHAIPAIAYASLTGIPASFSPSAHQHPVSDVTGLQAALDAKQASGSYATLVNGTVPSSMLPSFVDDVREAASLSAFPATGDAGVIYVATDSRKIYRWSGSTYVEISPSPGTTTDVPEGTNLYFTTARAAAAAPVQSVNTKTGEVSLTASDVGAAAASHTHSLASLTQSSATTGQVATWNGTAWVPASPSSGGLGPNDAVDGGFYTGITSIYADAPTAVSGTASGTSVALSWTAPASDGGTAISDYSVQYSSNGGSSWTAFSDGTSTATAASVTGLVKGTAYIFRVAARNTLGVGPWSSPSSAITPPITSPGTPTGVTAVAGNSLATLSWTPPADNGGAAVSTYHIELSANGGTTWQQRTASASGNVATITGLTNGTAYIFRVALQNSVGTGSYSSQSNSATPVALPFSIQTSWTANPQFTGVGTLSNPLSLTVSGQGNVIIQLAPLATGTITSLNVQVIAGSNSAYYREEGYSSGTPFISGPYYGNYNSGTFINKTGTSLAEYVLFFYPSSPTDSITLTAYTENS